MIRTDLCSTKGSGIIEVSSDKGFISYSGAGMVSADGTNVAGTETQGSVTELYWLGVEECESGSRPESSFKGGIMAESEV